MFVRQTHLHKRGMHGGIRGINRRKIRRRAYVGNDDAQIFRRNLTPDQRLHFGDFVLCDAEARAAGCLDVDHELPGIRTRKERQPNPREEQQAAREHHPEQHQREDRKAQYAIHGAVIQAQKRFEAVIEPDVEALARPKAALILCADLHRHFR